MRVFILNCCFMRRLLVATLLIFVPNTMIAAGDEIGDRDPAPTINWNLVDNNREIQTITGRVVYVKYNKAEYWFDDIWKDDDFCIHIDPDPEFDYIATNSAGVTNPSLEDGRVPAGCVEGEIVTVMDLLDRFFYEDMCVTICGWWCEDGGHDNKTELHPIRYITANYNNDPDTFAIFMGQDWSGRFSVAKLPYWQSFLLFINPRYDRVRPDSGHTGGFSECGMIFERSCLDGDILGSTGSGYNATVSQNPDYVRISLIFNAPGGVLDENGFSLYNPYYLGTFKRTKMTVFEDNVSYSVGYDASNQKYVQVTARIDLDEAQLGSPLAYSHWKVETWEGLYDVELYDEVFDVESPSRQQFQFRYSPALNMDKHHWTLGVVGSNKLPSDPPDLLMGRVVPRYYLSKQRTYSIKPSWIELELEALGSQERRVSAGPRPPSTPGELHQWAESLDVVITENFLPQVSYHSDSPPKWELRVLSTPDAAERRVGCPLPTDPTGKMLTPVYNTAPYYSLSDMQEISTWFTSRQGWVEVSNDRPFSNRYFIASLDDQDTRRMKIRWRDSVVLGIKLAVRVSCRSELGEDLWDYCEFDPALFFVWVQGLDYRNLMKAIAVINELLGRADDAGQMPPLTIDEFLHALRSPNLQRIRRGWVEPYELLDRLQGAPRNFLIAAGKLLNGIRPTNQEMRLLRDVATVVNDIPWQGEVRAETFNRNALRSARFERKAYLRGAEYPTGDIPGEPVFVLPR